MTAHSFNISYIPGGLAVSTSVLLLRLSSPKIASRLMVKCSSHIGQIYREDVVGRAIFIRHSPVVGEPLLSGHGGDRIVNIVTMRTVLIVIGIRRMV